MAKLETEIPKKVQNRTTQLFHPSVLITSIITTVFVAIVCMTIMGRIGIVPNTSIIGALLAIALGRSFIKVFHNVHNQNLVQTMCSGGGFGAGNAVFVPLAIILLMGRSDLAFPVILGAAIGTVLSVWIIGRIFDSNVFPASGSWPSGVATAEAILAGDEGGKKGRELLEGLIVGMVGTFFKVPVAGIGMAYIANPVAMLALGIGLILRGYSPQIFGINLGQTYIPQGIMIGASIIQLFQAYRILVGNKQGSSGHDAVKGVTVPAQQAKTAMGQGYLLFLAGAVVVCLLGGLWSDMGMGSLLLFLVYGAFSAWAATIICGLCAMNCGWFPSTSIVVIFLALGIFMGFPPLALALLGAYTASTGPCFADMGYDLKTGWILRRRDGFSTQEEIEGRRQQVIYELIGVLVGAIVVALFGAMYFNQGLIPPFPKVFKAAIEAGAKPEILKTMLIWAVPGAIIQIIGGAQRSVGVLFGVGLLLTSPLYGIACILGVIARKLTGEKLMEVRAPGLLAGDGIGGFVTAIMRTYF